MFTHFVYVRLRSVSRFLHIKLNWTELNWLQAVQNAATRLASGARRRDHVSPILQQPSLATSTTTSHFQVCRNRLEVCQRRRSNISTRTLCPSGGCPWSTTSTVCVNSLHFTASSSDLYWTAKFQRTWGVEQSSTSLARTLRHWLRLSLNWKRIYSVVHSDSWWPPGAAAAFFRVFGAVI